MREDIFRQFHKIALLGGTFNPVHIGHIRMAQAALSACPDAEQLIFLPNHIPAYKDSRAVAAGSLRLSMLELAIRDLPRTSVNDLELVRDGYTYTVDTLAQLRTINPALEICYVIGDDSLFSLHTWHEFERLPDYCSLLVAARSQDRAHVCDYIRTFCRHYPRFRISCMEMERIPVSSEEIRRQIAAGQTESIRGLVPDAVLRFIEEKHLYR